MAIQPDPQHETQSKAKPGTLPNKPAPQHEATPAPQPQATPAPQHEATPAPQHE
jgi:hypothetical protein